MPRQPEGRLVKAALRLIKVRGGRAFKIQGGGNFQEVGIPDILCCYRGYFIGLEAKQPGESPSPRQRVVLDEIAKAGGYAQAFTTVEEVEDLLTSIEKRSQSDYHPESTVSPSVLRRRMSTHSRHESFGDWDDS